MNLDERLRAQREGGAVLRCHTTPHHGHYDNAQHSFNMLVLLHGLFPAARPEVAKAIVYHDLAERYTGDLPAPMLLENNALRAELNQVQERWEREMGLVIDLNHEDWLLMKAIDKLEHWLWCHDQLGMGNRCVETHIVKLDEIFTQMAATGKLPEEIEEFRARYHWRRGKDGVNQ